MKHFFICVLISLLSNSVWAAPSRIVLLRHGEKQNAYALCDVGQQRSLALKAQFLGKGAEKSLFTQAPPAAFFATTLHTLELAAPSADSWDLPVITYSAVPVNSEDDKDFMDWVTRQTQRAATEVMTNPRWNHQTVVMVWEHKHIANEKLVKENPDLLVDLRQLLKLDQLPESERRHVHKTWSGDNYNFFWIVDYDATGRPIAFKEVRQDFTGQFANVPNNNWGVSENLPASSLCKQ